MNITSSSYLLYKLCKRYNLLVLLVLQLTDLVAKSADILVLVDLVVKVESVHPLQIVATNPLPSCSWDCYFLVID